MTKRLVIWTLLCAVAFLSCAAVPARADTVIEINLDSLTPQMFNLTQPEQRITLTGTVRNTTDQNLGNVSVHFWRSTTPITDHNELEQTLTSEATQPLGRRLPDANNDEANSAYAGDLSPGEEISFTVSSTVKDLGLSSDHSVYLLGAHVRGVVSSGARETVGRARVLAVASPTPLPVSTVVKLAAKPTLLNGSDFQDDSLETLLVGDLARVLEAAEQQGTTVLLDPSLLAEVRTLAGEHTVAGESAPPSQTAQAFAERLDALIVGGRVLRLPFGNPDLPRLHASGDLASFEQALTWSSAALANAELGPITELPLAADLGDYANQDLALTLAMHGYTTILGENITASGQLETTRGSTDATALRVMPSILPGVGPGNTMTTPQVTGRRLAEDLLADGHPVRLIRTAADVAAAQPLSDVEEPVALPQPQGRARFEDASSTPTLWPTLGSELAELFGEAQLLEELTATDRTAANATVAARASSASFVTEGEAVTYIRSTPVEQLDAEQVKLSISAQVVMGSDTNYFPVTIHNPLSLPVRVRVHFTSDAQNRLRVSSSELITISPGEHRTVNVTTVTRANGVVTVRAQLSTEQGTRFGPQIPVEITATGLGHVGWIIIIVSGAVVLGGTFLRIRAVQRERARENREH